MANFRIKQGDTLPIFQVTLKAGGVAVDLTGATVTFEMRDEYGAIVVQAAATPDADQVTNKGVVAFTFTAANTATAGKFLAEWKVDFGGGAIQTFPTRGFDKVYVHGDIS